MIKRVDGSGLRHRVKSVLLVAAIVGVGFLAAACVQSASGAGATSTPSASAPPTDTAPPSPTSAPPSPEPSVTTPSVAPTTAPASSPASSSGSSFDLIWVWVALGALVLLGIILWATRGPSRSSVPAASWRSRAADAYATGGALDGAVRAAERQGAFTEGTGGSWYDIQRHADDLTQRLYAMRETAPTEERRGQVADALAALQAIRYAVDAQRAPGGASARQSGPIHARLSDLESALNALRMPDDRLP
jgi:hypothetical protein